MIPVRKRYSFQIHTALERLLTEEIITSYKEINSLNQDLVEIELCFNYNNKKFETRCKFYTVLHKDNTDWRNVILNKIENRKRGEDNEVRMYKLLLSYKKKHIFGIRGVYRGSDYANNKLKADLVILVDKKSKRYILYLQVKSSEAYQQKHKEKHPLIPSIVINNLITDEKLGESLESIISTSIVILELTKKSDWKDIGLGDLDKLHQ